MAAPAAPPRFPYLIQHKTISRPSPQRPWSMDFFYCASPICACALMYWQEVAQDGKPDDATFKRIGTVIFRISLDYYPIQTSLCCRFGQCDFCAPLRR